MIEMQWMSLRQLESFEKIPWKTTGTTQDHYFRFAAAMVENDRNAVENGLFTVGDPQAV